MYLELVLIVLLVQATPSSCAVHCSKRIGRKISSTLLLETSSPRARAARALNSIDPTEQFGSEPKLQPCFFASSPRIFPRLSCHVSPLSRFGMN